MAEQTSISWTDHTFNPWIGCQRVAPGCEHCYAEAYAKRYGKAQWGPQGTRVKTSEAYWRQPLKWNRDLFVECAHGVTRVQSRRTCRHRWHPGDALDDFCPACGYPAANEARPRVFCASVADVFENWQGRIDESRGLGPLLINANGGVWPEGWPSLMPNADDWGVRPLTMDDLRRDLFALIDATPHLDWLLLTKRPENVRRMWPRGYGAKIVDDAYPFYRKNVWLGTSVSDQATADRNVPELLKCRDLVPVLFLSCEPLLGPIDLKPRPPELRGSCIIDHQHDGTEGPCQKRGVDWVIVGGESGPHHRPMDLDWARSLRDQCRAAGVPFFFKQSAGPRPGEGIELDGRVVQEFPVLEGVA